MENIIYCISAVHIIAYYTLHKLLKNTFELILKIPKPTKKKKRKMCNNIIIFGIENRYLLILI